MPSTVWATPSVGKCATLRTFSPRARAKVGALTDDRREPVVGGRTMSDLAAVLPNFAKKVPTSSCPISGPDRLLGGWEDLKKAIGGPIWGGNAYPL